MTGPAAALAVLLVLLVLGGADPARLQTFAWFALAGLALGLLWDTLWEVWRRRSPADVAPRRIPQQRRRTNRPRVPPQARPTILIDGSNVMHWNGNAPSAVVLRRVVQALVDKGERPHVYFDANACYKLAEGFRDAVALGAMIGLPASSVTVAAGGTPADPLLLAHAARDRLRVVTNDRFLDWKTQFPAVGARGFLVKGRWQEGAPILRL
ncbi:NYN domain-containing protein [Loktanella sp. M215]|uniref:NYN domain-containing protein n=1 Tax=Loktanella sp. M215 TaxID=2675431 RepID=UPI001F309E9B|nr:hypothetical protein [Loktanella sp. M215]MCF7701400.1 hypothetical protein [Loktanella sp. M215]